MGAFSQFVVKEYYHITRDYRTLFVLIGMPLIQLLLFGFAIRTEINDVDIGIMDHSKDFVTQEITNKLLSSGYFRLNANLQSDAEIEKTFKAGLAKEVIVFEPNFGRKLIKEGSANIQIISDASNPNVATLVNAYTTSIIRDYQSTLAQKGMPKNAGINSEIKMLYNPELKSVYMFVPGLIGFIMMLVSAMMTSIAITKEKEMGNMEILLVSPLRPVMIIIGKVIPYMVLSLFIAITILVMARTVFYVPMVGSLALFLAETLLFVITSLALGILISTVAPTQQIAMLMSLMGLMLPTMMLSGFIYPIDNMPVPLQIISNLIPAKWFLIIIKDIMLKGLDFTYIWKETLILAGMAVLCLALSMKKLKIRLE